MPVEAQLTQCEGDMITHAQQLAETHWTSIFVYPQLFHPENDMQNSYILYSSNTQPGFGYRKIHLSDICWLLAGLVVNCCSWRADCSIFFLFPLYFSIYWHFVHHCTPFCWIKSCWRLEKNALWCSQALSFALSPMEQQIQFVQKTYFYHSFLSQLSANHGSFVEQFYLTKKWMVQPFIFPSKVSPVKTACYWSITNLNFKQVQQSITRHGTFVQINLNPGEQKKEAEKQIYDT